MRRALVVAVAFSMSCTAPAFAALVTTVQGTVLVSGGGGYHAIPGSAEVAPGNSVLANPGSIGKIVYPDGCTVEVQPGSVAWIKAESPCLKTGATPAAPQPETAIGNSTTTFVVGTAVVLGGATAVYLLSLRSKAASP